MTTDMQTQAMPEMIVDRSPELARGARSASSLHSRCSTRLAADGVRGDGGACALAAVILANFPQVAEAHIEGEKPYLVGRDGTRANLILAPEIVDWIGKFDRGENPEPCAIKIGM